MYHRRFIRTASLGGLALGTLLATASPAFAGVVSSGYSPQALPQRVVSLRGLDLKQPGDVELMYARIRAAAQAVCGGEPVTGSRLLSYDQQRCMATSIEATVAAINRSELTARHRQATGSTAEHAKAGA